MKKLFIIFLILIMAVTAGAQEGKEEDKSLFNAGTFSGLKMRNIGPALMSGRIAEIALHPKNPNIWYVATGSGGVWKTMNSGTTWQPIFDKYGSYSIGSITIDPVRHETIWVGTGENVSGRHVGYGDGVYKSTDGGKSWKNMGLKESEHIGNIVVDPRDSNVVYVAAQGPLWSGGGERGLFKTTDGGETWKPILTKGEFTGVNEVRMDPCNPDVLYAATFQHLRITASLIDGGPESGIFKSTDAGATWVELKNGIPGGDKGKIGLAISPMDSNVIYATIEMAHRTGGFFRSANGGDSWTKQNDMISGGTGPHYYQEIFASPHKFDRVYQVMPRQVVTEDGGKTFNPVGEEKKHVDNHALAFRPNDPDYLLSGNDGGLYESWDLGKNWKFISNLPLTQFYKVAVDNEAPFYNIYVGAQDNGTQAGPNRTANDMGITSNDWWVVFGADGYQPATDPENTNIVYGHWQSGSLFRHDRITGENVIITPQPGAGEDHERWNWDAPILVSPHKASRIYTASKRLWVSEDRGDSWTAISPDLSRATDRMGMKMMGRVWGADAVWDNGAMSLFGNVTSLTESPVVEGLIYAGTDDGLVQVTEDFGKSWRKIEVEGIPTTSFVNDIKADLHDADTVYVAFDNHKTGDFKPYLMKSTDRGKTWKSIASDLPDRHLVWRLVQDHLKPGLMFTATEYGIFFTINGGDKWIQLKGGVPTIAFRDLAIQQRENDLVGASFGRSVYILDDYSPLRNVTEEMLESEATLFQTKDALWYNEREPYSDSVGAMFFVAPNPPHGAVFTYYMKDSISTLKGDRTKAEAKLIIAGKDNPRPAWDALKAEELQEKPAIILTVKDADGNVVNRIIGPASKGFNRVNWDMRYATGAAGARRSRWSSGPPAMPGTYSVHLAKRVDGVEVDLGQSNSFELTPLYKEKAMAGMDYADMKKFVEHSGEISRVLMGTRQALMGASEKIGTIKGLVRNFNGDNAAMLKAVDELEVRARLLDEALGGDNTPRKWNETTPPSIMSRFQSSANSFYGSSYGPTKTNIEQMEIAIAEFEGVHAKIQALVDVDLPALEQMLDDAGVAYTAGRKVPTLK